MENIEMCKNIADKLRDIVNGNDDECESLYDYFENAMDIDYMIDIGFNYKGVQIMVTCGGPTIYVSTISNKVELYWWRENAEYPLDTEVVDAIDEMFSEYYNASR